MREPFGNIEGLIQVDSRGGQPRPEVRFLAIARNRETLDRADIDTGVAFDAAGRHKASLDIAIQAALDLARGLFGGETKLHLNVELAEALDQIDVLHLLTLSGIVVVVIAPLAQPHLLADQVHALRRAVRDGNTLTMIVDRDRRLMRVL